MPKLPSEADLIGSRPNVSAPGGITAARPEPIPRFDAKVQGQLNLAQSLGVLSDDVATATLRQQEHNDQVRIEDSFNQLRTQQLDLTAGKDNGFINHKGADAVNQPLLEQYSARFDEAAQKIGNTLTDDRQKERFKQRAALAKADFIADILKHVDRESALYSQATYKGTIDLETRMAVSKYDEPNSIGLSLERVRAAASQEADRLGYKADDPQRQAMIMHATSGLHAAVISQALQNDNPEYAQQYFEKVKDTMDPAAAKQIGREVQGGVQKQLSNDYQTQYIFNRDDPKGLKELEASVSRDKKLDEDHRNVLLGRIVQARALAEAKAQRDEEKRLRLVQGRIGEINRLTMAGYEPTLEQMNEAVNSAKGTPLEGDAQRMVGLANATGQFRRMTPQEQEATITRFEAEARKDPTKFDVTTIDHFKRIYANQQQEIKQDPISFATRQGFVDQQDPSAAPIDFSDPANINGGQLKARFNLSRALVDRYQAPMKPLTKEETDALTGTLKGMPAAQKSLYFAKLAIASGNDFDGYKALMAQIAADDPVTAHAGLMAGRGRMTTDAGFNAEPGKATNVANLILQGQAVLHPDRKTDGSPEKGRLWPMPKDEDLAKQFQSYERDAFAGRPEARNGFLQTAKAIYAARSVEAGDGSGILDTSRWDEAMKLSTGGIEKWNGKSIVMPWGYARGQFKDELYRRIDDIADSGRLPEGVTPGKLHDMPLESIGDGRYLFRAGDGLLVDKAGKPLIVDFSNPTAFRASGEGLQGPGRDVRSGIAADKRRNPKPADLVPSGAAGARG